MMIDGIEKNIRKVVNDIGRLELHMLNLQSKVVAQRKDLVKIVFLSEEHGQDYYEHLDSQQIDVLRLAVAFSASYASLANASRLVQNALEVQQKE